MRNRSHKAYNGTTMLKSTVFETIKTHALIRKGERIGVAVSGGADSMALLHILNELKGTLACSLCVLHVEHGIRKEASKADMHFVQEVCKALAVPFYVKQENVPMIAAAKKQNVEATARAVRYAFFEEARRQYGIDKIAIAHHSDDYAETMLFHLVRGTGVEGLVPMHYSREPGIIRPMLNASRAEIESYLRRRGIAFCVDETNADVSYARNLLRREVMPVLKRINPEVNEAFRRAGDILNAEDHFLEEITRQVFAAGATKTDETIEIQIDSLQAQHIAIKRRVIRHALSLMGAKKDVSKDGISRVLWLCDMGQTGKEVEINGEMVAKRSYNTLIIVPKLDTIKTMPVVESSPIVLGWQTAFIKSKLRVEVAKRPEMYPRAESFVQYVDADKVKQAVLRYRQPGDIFKPFGMQGTKKLKDWLIDNKISRAQREVLPLLAKDNEILWIIGHAVSESCKVTGHTKQVWKLEYIEDEEENHG